MDDNRIESVRRVSGRTRRRLGVGACASVLLALVIGGIAYASSSDLRTPQTLRFNAQFCGTPGTHCNDFDLAPSGLSLADGFVFNVPLTDEGGKMVGTHFGHCQVVDLSPTRDECSAHKPAAPTLRPRPRQSAGEVS